MSKQEWKESGTELGHAFKNFGKTFIRSAERTTEKVVDFAEGKDSNVVKEPNSSVYSDGSWKEVGKDLGKGAVGIGKSLVHTVTGETPKSKVVDEEEITE